MLREEDARADLAHLVAGATDALESARHARRGLDLDDEVDGAHVDPELERRRRDDAAQAPRLEVVFDLGALLLAHRAVVRPREDRRSAARRAALPHHLRGDVPSARSLARTSGQRRRRLRGDLAAISAAISFMLAVMRSARRREFAKHDRRPCSSTFSTMARSTCGQIDPADCSPVSAGSPGPGLTGSVERTPSSVMSSTGTETRRSNVFAAAAARCRPARRRRGTGPPPRSAARSPRVRSAVPDSRAARRVARATPRGGRRASTRRRRGSRR